ncbi:kremen protein 1 isoform 3-T4 [Morphnus guianensis]
MLVSILSCHMAGNRIPHLPLGTSPGRSYRTHAAGPPLPALCALPGRPRPPLPLEPWGCRLRARCGPAAAAHGAPRLRRRPGLLMAGAELLPRVRSLRNPDGDVSPWCYIAEHEDGIYWKYCEIPSCRMPGNLGCYKDHGEPPLTGTSETSNKLTIQTCISSCRSQQFKFAGMESGYACFCGNNPDYWRYGEAASTECNSVCFGDHTQPCGGDGRVILFDTLIGACGGNYTSATAVIYSPDFPDTYGTGKVCYWTIQVPGASRIHFSFALFEIKDATDMVELLDGYTYHVLARFNGKNRPPHTFNISLDFVILYFFSDEINQAQGFAIRYRAVKDNVHQKKIPMNQTLSEKINEQANLSINAARSSKILYVITTSPSHPSSSMPEWTIYSLTALLILSITAIIAKIFLHITMRSHQIPSATETEDSSEVTTAGEIWSIFYQPSTSISIFKKKLRSQQDDCNPLVGN